MAQNHSSLGPGMYTEPFDPYQSSSSTLAPLYPNRRREESDSTATTSSAFSGKRGKGYQKILPGSSSETMPLVSLPHRSETQNTASTLVAEAGSQLGDQDIHVIKVTGTFVSLSFVILTSRIQACTEENVDSREARLRIDDGWRTLTELH